MHGIVKAWVVVFEKYTLGLPHIQGCDEASHESYVFCSVHIYELTERDYPAIGLITAGIVHKSCYGILIDKSSYNYVCWRHGNCHGTTVLSLIGINLGDRGKNKELRVIHIKHECERSTRTMRGVEHTCEHMSFLLNSNSSLQVIHYFDVAQGLKLFQLQDLRANLQQVREYDGNRLSIVFLQPYEDPFEWKIAWKTSGIKLHRRPAT